MGLDYDEYTSYCFNEACAVIKNRLEKGEEPVITIRDSGHYKTPSEMYKIYESK